MQMTSLSFWKILAGCTLAGVLAAGIWPTKVPEGYVSRTRIGLHTPAAADAAGRERNQAAPRRLQALLQNALSQASLASIIQEQKLYVKERNRLPMEEVVEEMRNRHLRVSEVDPADETALDLSFDNEDPEAAQATVQDIAASIALENWKSKPYGGDARYRVVLRPASLPTQAAGPNRMKAIGGGLGVGLVLGLVCGAIWSIGRRKERWRMLLRIGGFAATGMAVGLAIAFLIPNEYVSTALVRAVDGSRLRSTLAQVLSDDSLAAIVREEHLYSRELSRSTMRDVLHKMKNEDIRLQPLQVQPWSNGAAFTISFRCSDHVMAQTVMRDLLARLITISGGPLSNTEVVDSPSLPETPSYPNRPGMAAVGTIGGILLGLGASRLSWGKAGGKLVDDGGIEPPTSALRTQRSPS